MSFGSQRLPPVDEGLQVERTSLAWTRTFLAALTATAVIGRMALGSAGWAAFLLAGVVVTAIVWAQVVCNRRGAAAARVIGNHAGNMPDARLAAVVSVLILVLAVLESVYLIRGWW